MSELLPASKNLAVDRRIRLAAENQTILDRTDSKPLVGPRDKVAELHAGHHCTLAVAYHPLSVKLLGVCRMLLVDNEPIFSGKTLVLVS